MKVKSTRNWTISITAYCRECDFSFTADTKNTAMTAEIARGRARSHVATTGHEVEIFTEKFCVYKPVEVTP